MDVIRGGGGTRLVVVLLGEGVKHKSYLDPCLKHVCAYVMRESSRIFTPRVLLTPRTWGLKLCR